LEIGQVGRLRRIEMGKPGSIPEAGEMVLDEDRGSRGDIPGTGIEAKEFVVLAFGGEVSFEREDITPAVGPDDGGILRAADGRG